MFQRLKPWNTWGRNSTWSKSWETQGGRGESVDEVVPKIPIRDIIQNTCGHWWIMVAFTVPGLLRFD